MAAKDDPDYEKATATLPIRCTPSELVKWRAAFPKGTLSQVIRRLLNAETAAKAVGQTVLGPG